MTKGADAASVCVVGLTKRFGTRAALDGVSLEVLPGEVFGYLGPNGAGKTTTLRILVGLLQATAGRATALGLDCWSRRTDVARRTGYVPGDIALYPKLTGQQHLELLQDLREQPASAGAELAERLDLDLSRPSHALSRGNRQKLALTLGLAFRPELLVLDEPTTGLDPIAQHEFQLIVREAAASGATVLLSSHVLGEVQRLADRVGIIREGRLIDVQRLEELRAHALHHVSATFRDGSGGNAFDRVPGVRNLSFHEGTVRFSVPQTSLNAVLHVVAGKDVVDFSCVEADLEEAFLSLYRPVSDVA